MEEQSLDSKRKQTVRGKDLQDSRFFSSEALEKLRYAQEELCFLMDRNYPMAPIIKLIGDRYQFSTRQRLALQRSTCKPKSLEMRRKKSLPFNRINEGSIYIDGFNLIITLEVALSGGIILLGQDGAMRDLAGLRGNYRLIDKSDAALKVLGKVFKELRAKEVHFYLDSPVSNSGKLKVKIIDYAEGWGLPITVDLVNNPDTILSHMSRIVTTDAIILDKCESYFNLAAYCIQTYIADAFVIDLSK
jgi:hypothetical protein